MAEMQSVLKMIIEDLKRKTETIINRTEEIVKDKKEERSLKKKLSEQKRYSSKDCIMFENAPFDLNKICYIIYQFLDKFLQIKVKSCDIKLCHPTNKGNNFYSPTVIAKCVCFDKKRPNITTDNFLDLPKTRIDAYKKPCLSVNIYQSVRLILKKSTQYGLYHNN